MTDKMQNSLPTLVIRFRMRSLPPAAVFIFSCLFALLAAEDKWNTFGSTTAIVIDTDTLENNAKRTYKFLIPCMQNNPNFPNPSSASVWSIENDADIHSHYNSLLAMTEKYRKFPYHNFESFRGPWIENYFIFTFIDRPLRYFNGILPLFIQWSDYMISGGTWDRTSLFDDLKMILRHDVIYCMVSQSNNAEPLLEIVDNYPNVLIFGAGGFGHIPLPLIKGELINPNASDPVTFTYDIGFFGDLFHGGRDAIFSELKKYLNAYKFKSKFGKNPNWIDDMIHTKFNLAPRGFGPTSFRMAEIIQLERIPVYLYTPNEKFAAYAGTDISIESLGYSGEKGSFRSLVKQLGEASDDEIANKIERIKAARYFYTYEGVMRQMELFFENSFDGESRLRCQQVSRVHTWTFWWFRTKKWMLCVWRGECSLMGGTF